jgi:anti-anti-sigma factor
MPGTFDVSIDRRADCVDVRLVGDLDAAAVFRLEPVLEEIVVGAETRRIVFDLRDLTFIDSAGLAVLVAAHERYQARGFETSFVRPNANVMRVFEATGLDAAFAFRGPQG